MYLIEATEDFRNLVEGVCLEDKDLVELVEGYKVVSLDKILHWEEIKVVMRTFYTDKTKRVSVEQEAKGQGKTIELQRRIGLVHLQRGLPAKKGRNSVVIVVPPPPQAGGLGKTYKVLVRKSGMEGEAVTLQNGDILRLDEDEEMEATGGGIAFILLRYDVVPEGHDH